MEMKSMTLEQAFNVIKFAQKYHQFALWLSDEELNEIKKTHPKMNAHGRNIKYIDIIHDTRDNSVWQIKFRQGRSGWIFSSNHFSFLNPMPKQWKYDNLYDLCIAFLTMEFEPKEEFFYNPKD